MDTESNRCGGASRITEAAEAAVAVPRGGSTRRGRVRVRGGSSGPTVALGLREAAVMVPRGGSTRLGRVRVRGGSSGPTVALGLREAAVMVPRGPPRGRGARRGGHIGSNRPGPSMIEKFHIAEIESLPAGQGLETALHPYRKRQRRPMVETPMACRRSLRDKDLFYGSEPDSGESDDEDLVLPCLLPSSAWSGLSIETPIERENEDVPASAAAAPIIEDVPPLATDQPRSLYDFDWKPFPDAPIPPESRRETFSHIDVGPTAPCVDPYEIFVGIWDRQFMEYMASETNRYAQQVAGWMLQTNNLHPNSRIQRWNDTNADELYVYFAIAIAMGVVVKTRIQEYWDANSDVFSTPGFSAHMSGFRFCVLSKCLHFTNNADMSALELDGSEAKLFKVQPLLSHLNNKFQSMYRLGQNIALDESLLQWKGLLDIRQLIPNKAATMGIKTYELCESQTGYLWRFEVHAKTRSPPQQLEDPMNASTPAIVLRLIHGLEGKGHTLWMDNYYNSPCLARRLKTLGFDCVGTLRTDRKFVPQALQSLTKENMRQGQISGFTSGDVDVMVWRDNNKVAMISTYHGNAVSQIRGATKPILICDYNIMMGGVDKKDQMLAMYPMERKRTRVWYKKLFRRLLNVTVLNSYIIHRQSSSSGLSHRNFRLSLVKSLLSKHCHPPSVQPAIKQRVCPDTLSCLLHRLEEYPFGNTRVKHQRRRRKCACCGKLAQTFCVGCNKTMCIGPCFLTCHS